MLDVHQHLQTFNGPLKELVRWKRANPQAS
jgi:hypothetical protein